VLFFTPTTTVAMDIAARQIDFGFADFKQSLVQDVWPEVSSE
jgi:hypothetical protein